MSDRVTVICKDLNPQYYGHHVFDDVPADKIAEVKLFLQTRNYEVVMVVSVLERTEEQKPLLSWLQSHVGGLMHLINICSKNDNPQGREERENEITDLNRRLAEAQAFAEEVFQVRFVTNN